MTPLSSLARKRLVAVAVVLATAMLPAQVRAAGSCTSITTPAVGFGLMLNPGTANVTTITMMSALCSAGTMYSILMGSGLHVTGSGFGARRSIASGANLLPYDIFSDAGHSVAWGNGTTIGAGVSAVGTGATQQFPLYSVLNVPLTAVPGTYNDSVTVTISF
jgi:spore coat protein U-like protein